MQDLVLFDLDGTLADIAHRRYLVEGRPRRWREFYAACPLDLVNTPVAHAFWAFRQAGCALWIVSGRSGEVRKQTEKWLRDNDLVPDFLLMRREGDNTQDFVLKEQWLTSGPIPKERVLCVFDDRSSVVAMWRSHGLATFQVAPGDF